jgi:hypothetical protein
MLDVVKVRGCPFMQEPGLLRHAECIRETCALWVSEMCAVRALALSLDQMNLQGNRLLKDVEEVLRAIPK